MDWNLQDTELLRSYLLGGLSEEETERLEHGMFEDDNLFDLCEAVEADLLAAYARGELTATDAERVQRRLVSYPGGRKRLALARSLNAMADDFPEVQPSQAPVVPFWRRVASSPRVEIRWAALAAAALLAVIGILWLSVPRLPQAGPPSSQAENNANKNSIAAPRPAPVTQEKPVAPMTETPAPKDLRTKPDRLVQRHERTVKTPERPEPLGVAITLSLIQFRGAEDVVEEFRIPSGQKRVKILLTSLEELEDHKSFHVTLRSKDQETVWKGGLTPKRLEHRPVLVFNVPAESLPSGRYEVTVTAGTDELTQYFDVVRETR